MYKAIFILCYYGMMRIGEVTDSPHTLKAKNAHLATNKDKLLLIFYTSKMHDLSNRPQKIKITSRKSNNSLNEFAHRHFCLFTIVQNTSS